MAELGWDERSWEANEEHPKWYRELSGRDRTKATSIGLDQQLWDTKKFLASEDGRRTDGQAGRLILLLAAVLAAAAAAVMQAVERAADAAVWAKADWASLDEEEQEAAAALGLGLASERGWPDRFQICARVEWATLAADDARMEAAAALGMSESKWPPTPPEEEQDDVLGAMVEAAVLAEQEEAAEQERLAQQQEQEQEQAQAAQLAQEAPPASASADDAVKTPEPEPVLPRQTASVPRVAADHPFANRRRRE